MQIDTVVGRWQGDYWWDGADRPKVGFLLVLRRALIGKSRFSGSVRDSLENGMPGEGQVWGKLTDGRLTFTKKMPGHYLIFPDGRLVKVNGTHSLIHYEGDWFADHQEFRGRWSIDAPTYEPGDIINTGFWAARKEITVLHKS